MDDQPIIVPEWVCTLVGRLVLDNEALRRALLDVNVAAALEAAAGAIEREADAYDREHGKENHATGPMYEAAKIVRRQALSA